MSKQYENFISKSCSGQETQLFKKLYVLQKIGYFYNKG